MDFYFPDKSKAARFISFLENVCPIKVKTSKKLISTDVKSNISNFKYTNYVEICPLCKDDLVFLPSKLARNMGNISQLAIVKNISNVIHLIDPLSGQQASMSCEVYWREAAHLRPIITAARSRMTRYVVLSKEPVYLRQNVAKRRTNRKQKSRLASVVLAKEDDLGANDKQCEERSHVGYLLKAGDVCVGYDLKETQFVNDDAERHRSDGKFPDVVVVRKLYGCAASNEPSKAAMKRIWRLQRLDVDVVEEEMTNRKSKRSNGGDESMDDEEDFMQEVEADKDMRANMNLYKSEYVAKKIEGDEVDDEEDNDDDEDDDDDQKVTLDELLDGLALDDGPDIQDQAVAAATAEGGDSVIDDSMFTFVEGEKAMKDGITYIPREDARHVKNKDTPVPILIKDDNNQKKK